MYPPWAIPNDPRITLANIDKTFPNRDTMSLRVNKGGKRMPAEETTERYAKLWDRVKALDNDASRGLLCYVMGYCKHNEHFLEGVTSGLPEYEVATAQRAQENETRN